MWIEYGVDPAPALVSMAKARGVKVTETTVEVLPFPYKMFGGLLMAFALCFLDEPQKALREAWRVLQPEGGLVLGSYSGTAPGQSFMSVRVEKDNVV